MNELEEINKQIAEIKKKIDRLQSRYDKISKGMYLYMIIAYFITSLILTIIELHAGNIELGISIILHLLFMPFEMLVFLPRAMADYDVLNLFVDPIYFVIYAVAYALIFTIIYTPASNKESDLFAEIASEESKLEELEKTKLTLEQNRCKKLITAKATKLLGSPVVDAICNDFFVSFYSKIKNADRGSAIQRINVFYSLQIYQNEIYGDFRRSFDQYRINPILTAEDRVAMALAVAQSIKLKIIDVLPEDPSGSDYKLNFELPKDLPYESSEWRTGNSTIKITLNYTAPNLNYVAPTSLF